MRVYFEEETNTVVIENQERLFANTLIAEELNGKVSIRDKALNIIEVVADYTQYQKEDSSPAGNNIQEVIDYLNSEFILKNTGRLQQGVPFNDLNYLYAVFSNSNSTWDVKRVNRNTYTEEWSRETTPEPTNLTQLQLLTYTL